MVHFRSRLFRLYRLRVEFIVTFSSVDINMSKRDKIFSKIINYYELAIINVINRNSIDKRSSCFGVDKEVKEEGETCLIK